MSELLYLILPESSTCPFSTISFAKMKSLNSSYVNSLIKDLGNITWVYDIEDFNIMYDPNNVKAFLSFYDSKEKGELYKTATRLRLLFKESRYKQCSLESTKLEEMPIVVHGEKQTVSNIFYDILRARQMAIPVGILHKQVFNAQIGTEIGLLYQSKSEKISLLPLTISEINSWLAENRIPKRLYEWNPKHGENGKGQHSPQKRRGKVSVLLSDRNYPKELIGKAYGQTKYSKHDPKNNLYLYDSKHEAFIRFVPGGSCSHTYHAFHIEKEDLPNEIRNKYKIINPQLAVD